jgi:hypothetical protein
MILSSSGARPGCRLCGIAVNTGGLNCDAPTHVVGVGVTVVGEGVVVIVIAAPVFEWIGGVDVGAIPHGLPHSLQYLGGASVMSYSLVHLMHCAKIWTTRGGEAMRTLGLVVLVVEAVVAFFAPVDGTVATSVVDFFGRPGPLR